MKKLKVNKIKNDIEKACEVNDEAARELAAEFFNVDQVKEIFHFKNKQTVYNLAAKGKLPCIRITGKLLFRKKEIEKMLKG